MSEKYEDLVSTKKTPQTEPIPGREEDMTEGRAGGQVFPVDNWMRLDRFLILGSSEPTYYASARELTRENAKAVMECLNEDGVQTVERIIQISDAGRAPSNEPALFALAIASADGHTNPNQDHPGREYSEAARLSLGALPDVARIPTHLFKFLTYRQAFAGWGQSMRWAVTNWYAQYAGDPEYLGYHLAKYRSRYGWEHRDVMRKAHPTPRELKDVDPAVQALVHWTVHGWGELTQSEQELIRGTSPEVTHFEEFRMREWSPDAVADRIREYGLPREVIPGQYLKHDEVWEALADDMPIHALIRNLGTLTSRGVITPMGDRALEIADQLTDAERLEKARVHPIDALTASVTYKSGGGRLGSNTWTVAEEIADALDDAFRIAFQNVEPAGKRHLLALDVSGSMSSGNVAGVDGLTPRMGAAAMALQTVNVERHTHTVAFSDASKAFTHSKAGGRYGRNGAVMPFPIKENEALDDLVDRTRQMPFSGTDCALPMLYALENEIPVDAFVVYTDSETWAGDIHPSQALDKYRREMGIPAKLIVVGMQSNGFTIADPDDAGMMDVVGFDTATPRVIADFVRD